MPLAPDVARVLDGLSRWEWFTGEDDLVFPGELGSFLDGSALRRRYKAALAAAGLRQLRFHDLRHTFGIADDREGRHPPGAGVDGHADIRTTMCYRDYAPRAEDGQLVAEAFRTEDTGIAPAPESEPVRL